MSLLDDAIAQREHLARRLDEEKARADKATSERDADKARAVVAEAWNERFVGDLAMLTKQRDRLMLEVAELRQAQHVIDSSAVNMAAHQAEQQRDRLAGLLRGILDTCSVDRIAIETALAEVKS